MDFPTISAAMQTYRIDFDNAYQYVITKRDHLTPVSFDSDFDRTDLQRQAPAQVLAALPPHLLRAPRPEPCPMADGGRATELSWFLVHDAEPYDRATDAYEWPPFAADIQGAQE